MRGLYHHLRDESECENKLERVIAKISGTVIACYVCLLIVVHWIEYVPRSSEGDALEYVRPISWFMFIRNKKKSTGCSHVGRNLMVGETINCRVM